MSFYSYIALKADAFKTSSLRRRNPDWEKSVAAMKKAKTEGAQSAKSPKGSVKAELEPDGIGSDSSL